MKEIGERSLAIVITAVFVAGIGLTMTFNLWTTEASKTPAIYTEGEFAGEYNPADIRGSYSLGEIGRLFDVPVEDLSAAFHIDDENAAEFQPKYLEKIFEGIQGYEIGTDSVRLFVAAHTGRPFTPEETTALPRTARPILKERFEETGRPVENLESYTFLETTETAGKDPEEAASETSEKAYEVRGKTTFGELLTWGVAEEDLAALLGGKTGPRSSSVRDWCIEEGIEFSMVKNEIQRLVDQLD
ncbi:MAG: hypothetical protein K9L68_08810 [Spirochaetales bacterium]|nr:hypothetical protein [Spirochaetales bacterium]MCF7938686.1 hypothetical protein [Spirochaetales bacterium]